MIVPISQLEIPEEIVKALKIKGIEKLTPPQAEAVRKGLFKGKNLVVATPTASGKTLIAEMALLYNALKGYIGIYATPLKALANEKFDEFRFWEEKLGIPVAISTGDYSEVGESLGRAKIIVTTYERLDSILRHRPSWLSKLGVVVVDELHSIGDPERGPIVELIVTRALYMGKQVIGLSATVGNPEVLAKWMNAELITIDWRPVKLIEGYYDRRSSQIVFSDGRVEDVDQDLAIHCALKAMEEDYQLLIFKHSRRQAESLASRLASVVEKFLEPWERERLRKVVDEYRSEASSRIEFEMLAPLIERGVAYHHAGLSHSARKIIERYFRERLIKIVVATPTLSAGINLPARRVLIYTKRFENGRFVQIPIAEYKQMAGRAGRPGLDPYGEAVIADAPNARVAEEYIKGKPEPVESKLWNDRALRIHVLAAIASGYASNSREIVEFFSKTLGAYGARIVVAQVKIISTLNLLEKLGMVVRSGGVLIPTKLGESVSKLYIDPVTAHVILKYLESQDHVDDLYYLMVVAMTPDFERVRVLGYKQLTEEALNYVDAGLIPPPPESNEFVSFDSWLRAFKIAKILHSWINEVDEDEILQEFGIGLGDLSNIVETATWLMYAASKICQVAGLDRHAQRLETLTIRVEKGVKEDVVELVKVRGIGRVRARILAQYGIKTLKDLANLSPSFLARLPYFGEKLAKQAIEEARELVGGGR